MVAPGKGLPPVVIVPVRVPLVAWAKAVAERRIINAARAMKRTKDRISPPLVGYLLNSAERVVGDSTHSRARKRPGRMVFASHCKEIIYKLCLAFITPRGFNESNSPAKS